MSELAIEPVAPEAPSIPVELTGRAIAEKYGTDAGTPAGTRDVAEAVDAPGEQPDPFVDQLDQRAQQRAAEQMDALLAQLPPEALNVLEQAAIDADIGEQQYEAAVEDVNRRTEAIQTARAQIAEIIGEREIAVDDALGLADQWYRAAAASQGESRELADQTMLDAVAHLDAISSGERAAKDLIVREARLTGVKVDVDQALARADALLPKIRHLHETSQDASRAALRQSVRDIAAESDSPRTAISSRGIAEHYGHVGARIREERLKEQQKIASDPDRGQDGRFVATRKDPAFVAKPLTGKELSKKFGLSQEQRDEMLRERGIVRHASAIELHEANLTPVQQAVKAGLRKHGVGV